MENNIDYKKLMADEAKARQEAEAAAKTKAAAEKQRRLEREKEMLKKGVFWSDETRAGEMTEKARLELQRRWLPRYLSLERDLYPFPDVVPDELGQWIAECWENTDRDSYGNRKRRKEEELPEQIQKIIKERQIKRQEEWELAKQERAREEQEQRESERKQRESARWAWENGRKKRLLADKTNTELLAMIELNLREISYWLEHYAFKSRRY